MTDTPPPLFIVGAPRSGTTMLAAMFGSHPLYAAGPESQFFSKIDPARFEPCVADDAWPRMAVQCLAELELAGQPVLALFGTDQAEATGFLAAREPSVAAMLEALTVPFARKRGKPGWIEKTPNHMLNLPLIRQLWPDAWIVRIMRDPRDSAASTCKLPTFSDSFAANIYMWRRWQDACEPFMQENGHSLTIRYESLVEEPAAELTRLCTAIGVPFDPAMIDFGNAAADVSSAAETWKRPVSGGLSKDRLFAWKSTLDPRQRQLADQVTHEYLVRFNYDHQPLAARTKHAFRMADDYVERHLTFLFRQLDRGIRWLPVEQPNAADAIVDQPPYHRFRDPRLMLRLATDRFRHRLGNSGAAA